MKKITSLLLVLFLANTLTAQQKKYTMRDAVLGLYLNLAPENIAQTTWIPNENAFSKVNHSSKTSTIVKVSVPSMHTQKLFDLATLNHQLFSHRSLRRFPQIHWINAHTLYFKVGDILYKGTNTEGAWQFSTWVELPKNTTNFYVNPHKLQVAYSKANNLYIADAEGNKTAITSEKDLNIVSGQIVSRNEFGVDRGVFFAPKGNLIAFYQKDESKVQNYPVINWDSVPAIVKYVKYPMAGRGSEKVSLGVYNTETQQTVWMKVEKAYDDYLTNVTWSPDGKSIYIATLKRNQQQLTLNQYSAETGRHIATLFKESDPKYLHPLHPMAFIPGHDDQFLWWSLRDGFLHLYRYNTQGKLLNQVTSGDWVVNAINGWIPNRNEVIISSSKLSPMDKTVYAVNWKNGKIRRLDNAPGIHKASVSTNGKYWIDRYNNYTTPNKISVAATRGTWNKVLLDAPNPLKNYAQPKIKELTLTAADGKTPLYARLILPPDFNPAKKYPVIVYLYNGPGIQLLHHSFPESGNLWYDYMAQHGYIIFTMDGRGSSNRGMKFEQVTFRHLGTVEMKDQLQGVKYLKSLPYVDANRLGIHGWSFGGFMTTSFMLRHPGVFKVGVAGGPVIDWRMYEVMYTERYMDTPQENPKGYAEASLLDKVQNLKGKLLIIHGGQDSTVVWQQSMRFLESCIKHRVQVDYFVYPDHPHNVRGFDRIHLMQKITDYFNEFLK